MVKIICEIDGSYEKFVFTSKTTEEKRLSGKYTMAVYGTPLLASNIILSKVEWPVI